MNTDRIILEWLIPGLVMGLTSYLVMKLLDMFGGMTSTR